MPSVKFDMSDIKPLLGTLGLGQAPPPPAPINSRPIQPLQLPPTPAVAGFTEWSGDPKNQQMIADSLTMPGTPITPPNVPPASPLSGSPTPPPARLGSGIPIDHSASVPNIMPPQRAPMAFLNPPSTSSTANSFPPLSPSNPYSNLFSNPGDDKSGTASQRAFPGPVTAASGLHDKLVAANITAPNPIFPPPRPFLVPPTSNPSPINPLTPPPAMPQLPQAASGQQFAPLGQGPENPMAGVQPLPGYGPAAAQPASIMPPTGSPSMPANAGPMQLLPYQNKLQADQTELQRQQKTGSGVSQIKNPWLRTIARIGDVAGSIVAPGIATAIPGTTYHHDLTMAQQGQRVQGDRQDIQDVTQSQQAAANLAHTTAETADIGAKSQQQAARYGLKQVTDPGTGITTLVPDTDSPYYKQQQDKDTKLQAQTALISAQVDDTKAQKELRDAQTAFNQAKTDPSSPLFKQTAQRLAVAQQNANAAGVRAKAYMGNYMQHAYNLGLDGQYLPGTPIISDDDGNQTHVGSTNAPLAVKNQANAAQFNDVHGALDSVEQAASNLVQGGGRLNSPGVAAALAQPKGTLEQWLQGAGVKANLSPTERAYVQAIAAAHENVQALRKSAGGTATDSAVEKLDALIPGVSTPDLNYLFGQTNQIRQTAERLGKGATVATGGLSVRGQANKGGITVTAPDGSIHPFKSQAAADRFKKLAGITK